MKTVIGVASVSMGSCCYQVQFHYCWSYWRMWVLVAGWVLDRVL